MPNMTTTELDITSLPYRPGVGMMVLNQNREVLVAQRLDSSVDTWQMPQGGIEKGETPLQAALRELNEEIGTANVEVLAESQDWLHYDYTPELIQNVAKGRCRGIRQKWFLMRFLGHDKDIDLNTSVPEFHTWRWTELETLPDLVFPLKRPLYKRLVAEFGELVRNQIS